MRKLGWLGVFGVFVAVATYGGRPVAGQQQQPRPYGTPPPLVITAFGGKPVDYKAPRTPWGDPDLQGVWSSDDMEGVGIAGGGGRGGGGRGRGGRGAAQRPRRLPQAPPPRWSSAAVPRRRGAEGSPGSDQRRPPRAKRQSADELVPLRLRTPRVPADAPARRSAGRPHAERQGRRGEPRHAARHLRPRSARLLAGLLAV